MRRALGIGAGGTLLSASLAAGWVALAIAGAVVIAVILALCWIIADSERPGRLALLLTAWRETSRNSTSAQIPASRRAL